MAGKQEDRKVSRSVESLGWLSQSGVQPKKQRMIEGVSASSLVAFKSELYKVQQEQQAVKEGMLDPEELRQRRKGLAGILERKNAGVAERDTRDRLQLKTDSDRASESYAALEKKAQLYERLARGEAVDDEDKYEVDFLMKGREPAPDTAEMAAYTTTGGLSSADMARERERRDWEARAHEEISAAELREQERERRRQLLDEVIDETEVERQRAAEKKREREAAEQQKRERLKAAFLKKQLETLKAKQGAAGQQQRQQQGAAGSQRQQQGQQPGAKK